MNLMRKVLEASDARTAVQKARAIDAALDAIEGEVDALAGSLSKVNGSTDSIGHVRGDCKTLQARIANLEAQDRLNAARRRAPQALQRSSCR
jgi:hypothetical protein